MANSNGRIRDYETVHHLGSRIAHRVYFLKEEERMDFLEIVRRAAEFTGIQLIGWCIMGNHFHLLVYLPMPPQVNEAEVIRRYGILYGARAAERMVETFGNWRLDGELGERRTVEWLDRQRRRMYDVGSFMKIVKQWFTVEYNKRHGHKGTLWEAAYFDRIKPRKTRDMAECLGYIHLNPIRAAATDKFDGYVWSSYSAFRKGEPIATAGMRFVYGEETSVEEMVETHEHLLQTLLEKEKLRRAEVIARRRAGGYEVPTDSLTTEAMVAQESAHLDEVLKAATELHEVRNAEKRRSVRRELREKEVLAMLIINPEIEVPQLAERMGVGVAMTYRILARLKKRGLVWREAHGGKWSFKQ